MLDGVGKCYPDRKSVTPKPTNAPHVRAQKSAENRVFSGTSRKNRENPRGARTFAMFAAESRKIRDFRAMLGPETGVHLLVSV